MKKKKESKVLKDYIRDGKILYPPFLHSVGNIFQDVDRYREIMPEIIWLSALVKKTDFKTALLILRDIIPKISKILNKNKLYDIGMISVYLQLNSSAKNQLLGELHSEQNFALLKSIIMPIVSLYPQCPLKFYYNEDELSRLSHTEKDLDELKEIVYDYRDKYSKTCAQAQGLYIEIQHLIDKFIYNPNGPKPVIIDHLEFYPETEISQEVAGRNRTTAIMMKIVLPGAEPFSQEWIKSFWQTNREIGDCIYPTPIGISLDKLSISFCRKHLNIFKKYDERMNVFFEILFKELEPSFKRYEEEIILGLTTRIYRLIVHCFSFIHNWVADILQIYLRLISDAYIVLAWLIKKGTEKDYLDYYNFGLGQQKLHSEHTKEYLINLGLEENEIEEINYSQNYLKNHRLEQFIPVNLANWTKKSIRDMAIEIDQKHIYTFFYNPSNSAVHGGYDAIDRFYLIPCTNPFHGEHKIPYYWTKNEIDLYSLENILQIGDEIFNILAQKLSIKDFGSPGKDAFETLLNTKLSV
ncbi:DUF5677 domain-containing protein [Leptospira santarosai]|uniref:Uncharacterized protein n=2 Tax=Leptospira santarosai TaxID=28183 RepID=K8Y8I9_9LEPT|nr:DUF5677 domain-containing protein [Leptospira santarosai]EKT86892.1 hypothetical protein LSS_09598 [Leptospira santarosai serovar Shermani str. LT 821]EMO84869.1 hypothetical protein LEP1GSC070_2215 [Leptospira santarosai str. AIM]EPG82449.1 hypothetical protein LEP1GSC048_3531 [Leptospira santarosai serovar Shermani str. 1342KT]